MNILHPSPGDLLDRQTILDLKISHSRTDEQRQRFQLERHAIAERVGSIDHFPTIKALYSALQEINGFLWGANEVLATLPGDPLMSTVPASAVHVTADLAIRVYRWNLERNRLIEAIDQTLGAYQGPEKI